MARWLPSLSISTCDHAAADRSGVSRRGGGSTRNHAARYVRQFDQPNGGSGGKGVRPHLGVERAGRSSLNEGQTIEYESESNRGKKSAVNLKIK